MSFITDKQTLDDLNITGRYKRGSIYRLFDQVVTAGGRRLLDEMFQRPLTNAAAINKRCSIFAFFGKCGVPFPFTDEAANELEDYLNSGGGSTLTISGVNIISQKILQAVARDKSYDILSQHVRKAITILHIFYELVSSLHARYPESPFEEQFNAVGRIFLDKKLQWLFDEKVTKEFSLFKLIRYDYLLRIALYEEMKIIMDIIFQLDLYISVSTVARTNGFCYPKALPKENNMFSVNHLYHPAVENAVGNSLSMHGHSNVLFLTGANMAGKSTLMKSIGIAVYLAHMGFPVAAGNMEFSIRDGLYSSINVPDNLDLGYSHFYAEVLRVKKVAEEVAASKDLVVIFDELFKGTNVKDAYDATLAITEAFSENRNCFFVISTHIIEVGETLRERCENFRFNYLPTTMEGNLPRYTYRLEEGITTDRHGMIIIENEGILDTIRAGNK